jgi:hypothetical protein
MDAAVVDSDGVVDAGPGVAAAKARLLAGLDGALSAGAVGRARRDALASTVAALDAAQTDAAALLVELCGLGVADAVAAVAATAAGGAPS